MKLTVGRMAHVKLEKGCAEALLMGMDDQVVGSPVWRAVVLRALQDDRGFAVPKEVAAEPASVHEPYGCMREIVMLPRPEERYSFFRPLPGSSIDPTAPVEPAAPEAPIQRMHYDPKRDHLMFFCPCGVTCLLARAAIEDAIAKG